MRDAWTPQAEVQLSQENASILEALESDADFLDRWALIPSANNARRLAWAALLRGDGDGYERELRSAIDREPARVDSREDLSKYLLFQKSDTAAAEAVLSDGLEHTDEDAKLLYLIGVLRAMSGDPEAAVDLFQRSLESDPHSLQARENLAGMLCQLGRLEEGVAQYKEALSQREDPSTLLLLAQALLALENPLEALSYAKRASELIPNDPFPREVVAECTRRLSAEAEDR